MTLLAYGQNTNSTLSTSPAPFLDGLCDVSAELGVNSIKWTGWGGTVGYNHETRDYLIWGFAPSALHQSPCPLPPTVLDLPARPRAFVGFESLEAIVSDVGQLYVPDERSGGWVEVLGDGAGGWLDVKQLGTGVFLGLHRNDLSQVVQATSIQALSDLVPAPRDVPLHTAIFKRLVPSTSHALALPAAAHLHAPHALGSNLHSQLARPISPARVDEPVPLELLEGLGEVEVQAAGVHGLALTKAGEVFVWGGRYGVPDQPLDLDGLGQERANEGGGEDEEVEPLHVVAASIGSTGAVVLGLSDGRVVASHADEVDLLPTRPVDGPQRRSRLEKGDEWGWKELRGVGGREGERGLREIVPASGGRGWLLLYDD